MSTPDLGLTYLNEYLTGVEDQRVQMQGVSVMVMDPGTRQVIHAPISTKVDTALTVSWNTLSSLPVPVTSALAVSWNVAPKVTRTLAVSWNVAAAAKVAKTHAVTWKIASASIWQPTMLAATTYTRPTGTGFVTWESIVGSTAAAAQAAAPNTATALTQTLLANAALAGKVLTLPKGLFTIPANYNAGNNVSLGFGNGYNNTCRGLAGSGAGGIQASATETVIQHAAVATTNGTLIRINNADNAYFAGLSFRGIQVKGDNVYQGGIVFGYCTGRSVIENCYFRGFSPGYASYPPGETFGINVFHTPNLSIRNCEADGRDKNGVRTCASWAGWNTVVNDDLSVIHVQRCYAHHGLCSMLTFWETTNVNTEDYYVYSWPTSTGSLGGTGINHEQSGGRIRHVRPRLFMNNTRSTGPVVGAYGHPTDDATKQNNTSSSIFSCQSGLTDAGLDFQLWYPQWDQTFSGSGILTMAGYDGYGNGNALVTAPQIYLRNATDTADVQLGVKHHPASGWNTADPLLWFAWLH